MKTIYSVYLTSPKGNIWHLQSRYYLKSYKSFNNAVKLAEKFGACFVAKEENNQRIDILYSF